MKKLYVLVIVMLVFAGCDNESGDPKCNVPATIRDLTGFDGCGFVFELEDGSRLEPIRPVFFCGTPPLPKEVTEDPLYNYNFVDGKKVLISYDEDPRPSICMIGPTVKITCITDVIAPAEN